MIKTVRAILATTMLAGAAAIVPIGVGAVAQTGAAEANAPKQIALTQSDVDKLIAAQKDIRAAEAGAPADKPDPATEAKVAAVVKKHGFASLDQFADVSFSVGLVMSGIDPETKQFVGAGAVIHKQLQQVQADTSMPPKDKKDALAELNGALEQADSDKPLPGNIGIVKANVDKLAGALQQGD